MVLCHTNLLHHCKLPTKLLNPFIQKLLSTAYDELFLIHSFFNRSCIKTLLVPNYWNATENWRWSKMNILYEAELWRRACISWLASTASFIRHNQWPIPQLSGYLLGGNIQSHYQLHEAAFIAWHFSLVSWRLIQALVDTMLMLLPPSSRTLLTFLLCWSFWYCCHLEGKFWWGILFR